MKRNFLIALTTILLLVIPPLLYAYNTTTGYTGSQVDTFLQEVDAMDSLDGLISCNGSGTFSAKVIGTDVQAFDAFLDDIAGLTDPNADRILFWDDSAGGITWLSPGTGLTISGTDISVDLGTSIEESEFNFSDVTTGNATTTMHGLLPKLDGSTSNFLRGDGTWATPSGGGDVSGPASAVDSNFASFDGTTGKTIKDSGYAPSDFAAIADDETITGTWTFTEVIHADGGIQTGASATPSVDFDDSDTSASTDAKIYANATDTTGGSEDVDLFFQELVNGTLTTIMQLDADGYVEVANDINLASGKVYRINGSQISSSDLSDGNTLQTKGTASSPIPVMNIVIDGGGSAITTGVKGEARVPEDVTITGWYIFADQSGSIVVDLWKDSEANYPPTSADTVTGTEKPTLSSAAVNSDTSLTSWTDTTWTAGEFIRWNVDSASTVTRCTVQLLGYYN